MTRDLKRYSKLSSWNEVLEHSIKILTSDIKSLNTVKEVLERKLHTLPDPISLEYFLTSDLTLVHVELMYILYINGKFNFYKNSTLMERMDYRVKNRYLHYKAQEFLEKILNENQVVNNDSIESALNWLQFNEYTQKLVNDLSKQFTEQQECWNQWKGRHTAI